MAKAKRIEIDLAKLEELDKRVSKLQRRDSPEAEAVRERIRIALRSRTRGDGMRRLEGAKHCLDLMQIGGALEFGPDPEAKVTYLATAIERLAALAEDLNGIEVKV